MAFNPLSSVFQLPTSNFNSERCSAIHACMWMNKDAYHMLHTPYMFWKKKLPVPEPRIHSCDACVSLIHKSSDPLF
jgi:hypothetical protein